MDLAKLVLNGLQSNIRERLEGYEFLTINQVLQRALAQESRSKDTRLKSDRPNTHIVDYDFSDDESKDVYAAEFKWSANEKPCTCTSLRPIQKNWQDGQMHF